MESGTQLGHYTIQSLIGKGGMGEVYQAKDETLGRQVAIKVLPEEFALDAERVARFQREAQLLASLNHPNIAAIHGLEETDGKHFLVLELVDGDTLADRIKNGPIAVEQSLTLGLQIAEALEAAHEKGVIHRDLKPANIKITPEGKVKVLDFGLAKALEGDSANLNLSNSPTISMAATQQGVILGTAAYMSPEQARGVEVDKRADIWAYGCVLYEMLTGRQAFRGELMSDVMASVLKSNPSYQGFPPAIHPQIKTVLKRCLEKDPKNRYRDIGDVSYELRQVEADPSGSSVEPPVGAIPAKPQSKMPWVAGLVGAVIVVGVAVWMLKPSDPAPVVRFDHELPEDLSFRRIDRSAITVSPDGRQVVYNTSDGLYLLSVDEFESRLIPGTDSPMDGLTFSPDGEWIGYWSNAGGVPQIQKVSVNGGAPVVVADVEARARGLSWGENNTIVYSDVGPILSVSGNGGAPEPVMSSGRRMGQPQMLPGGEAVLFRTDGQVAVQSLDAEEPQLLFPGAGARYLPTGHIVYFVDGSLYAQGFELANLEVVGGPVLVVEGVAALDDNFPHYAVSDSGTLAYIPGVGGGGGAQRSLVWVDRAGNEEAVNAEPGPYQYPRISPDGSRVAIDVRGDLNDILVWDLVRETRTRLTPTEEIAEEYPIWTSDGQRIAYGTADAVLWKASDGSGVEELLFESIEPTPFFFSPTDAGLVFGSPESDIGMVMLSGDAEPVPLFGSEFLEMNAALSPDGNWIAYESNESGELEVYVRPFPNVGDSLHLVSNAGGRHPVWAANGRELLYLEMGTPGSLMSVLVETGSTLNLGIPEALFEWDYVIQRGRSYDVSSDGQRFLALKNLRTDEVEETSLARINIVLNWFEELKERVPVP